MKLNEMLDGFDLDIGLRDVSCDPEVAPVRRAKVPDAAEIDSAPVAP